MSYPSAVTPFVRRLQSHSTNVFKIEPSGARSGIGAGQVVSFQLPSNSLVDLRSVKWMFNAKITSANVIGRLPNKIASLIERYSVEAGGVTIYQGSVGYNVVKHAVDALELGDDEETTNNVQKHEYIPRLTSTDNVNISAANEAPVSTGDATQFCVTGQDLMGFFEMKPEILDLSLLPEVTLKFYLAPNNVCTDSAGTGLADLAVTGFNIAAANPAPVYEINNQRLLVTTYSINDGMYDMMIETRIRENGFLECPFKQYFCYPDGNHTGSTRFSIGTQSLDRLYAVWRPTLFATMGAPTSVAGYKVTGAVPAATGQLEHSTVMGEKYIAKAFNFPRPTGITSAFFQLNSSMYPQFPATSDEWYQISVDSCRKNANAIKSLKSWQLNYHVYSLRLNQPDADELRLISGLDTRSMNMAGSFNSSGISATTALMVICECTSTLRIGAGLAISVVV